MFGPQMVVCTNCVMSLYLDHHKDYVATENILFLSFQQKLDGHPAHLPVYHYIYAAICSVDIYFYYLQNLQNVKYTIVDIWVKLKDSLVIGFISTA